MVKVLDEALELVEKCFQEYQPNEVVVCFNGGKDCIVMLHLIHSHFARHFPGAKLQGGNSVEKFWLEFWLEKWLEIPF